MEYLLLAGATSLAAYAYGKRRERCRVANGYVTVPGDDDEAPEYVNFYYGKTGHHRQPSSQYYATTTKLR